MQISILNDDRLSEIQITHVAYVVRERGQPAKKKKSRMIIGLNVRRQWVGGELCMASEGIVDTLSKGKRKNKC
jgi:hypothetical protein